MAAASCDGKIHSSATFSTSYDEVIAALRCCFVQRIEGLAWSPSAATYLAPLINVPAVEDTLVEMINRTFRFQKFNETTQLSAYAKIFATELLFSNVFKKSKKRLRQATFPLIKTAAVPALLPWKGNFWDPSCIRQLQDHCEAVLINAGQSVTPFFQNPNNHRIKNS